MNKRVLLPSICYAILASVHMPVIADDKPMDVFAPLLGNWTTRSVTKPSLNAPKQRTGTGEFTAKLILGGKFIRLEGNSSSTTQKQTNFEVIMTYDQRKQVYRRWVYRADGFTAESTGVWNAERKTMVWSAIGLPKGMTFTITSTIKKEHLELTMFGKNADGTILMDVRITSRRK